jgi:branched-chain amino acid aminotransferase
MSFVYLNGALLPVDRAMIACVDRGFLLGHGLFETIRVANGQPVAVAYHLERFYPAAAQLGLSLPDQAELMAGITSLIAKNQVVDARLRITLTGGDSTKCTLLMTTEPLPLYPAAARVVTAPYTRNEKGALAGIKSTSYGESLAALRYVKEGGADDAIFANTAGQLCEGATTNVFVIIGGIILTPPLSSGCLPGVTRRRVLEYCRAAEIPIDERNIDLPLPDEVEFAFLTSSLRGLQPIADFDGRKLPVSHPVFDLLRGEFR